MSTITQRIASAFVVLCGRYGDVTKMATRPRAIAADLLLPRGQSGLAMLSTATAVQSRIDELQRQLAGQQAQIQDLQERLGSTPSEITRDKQDEVRQRRPSRGCQPEARRGGCCRSWPGREPTPSVPTLGRATEEAANAPASRSKCIDQAGRTQGQTGHRRRNFFGPETGLDARRTRQPALGRGTNGRSPRWPDVGCGIRPVFGACSGVVRAMAAAWARG